MFLTKLSLKFILSLVFVTIIFSTLKAKDVDKFNNGMKASGYFSGILLLNDNNYSKSYNFFKKLDGLEEVYPEFSKKYLYSSVILGKINEAFKYSKNLEKKGLDNFESNLIIGVYHLKNKNYDLAEDYFSKIRNSSNSTLKIFLSSSLQNWSSINNLNLKEAEDNINKIDDRFKNLKTVQKAFLYCFFKDKKTENFFKKLSFDKSVDYSRYDYFYSNYLINSGKILEGNKILDSSAKKNPRNLLINQFKIDLKNKTNQNIFDCRNNKHIIAEIFYITANALSSQEAYLFSNFYISLAKHLNKKFYSFDTLLAENYFKIENLQEAKKIYLKLNKYGEAYSWYSAKQISRIFIKQNKKNKAIENLNLSYKKLSHKSIYDIFDYAEFLKNNEKFKNSIKYYSEVLKIINKDHPLYSEIKDGRGVSYERIGEWNKAEKDLLSSLEVNPDQAYVINYLAYSWIEKNIKVEESLKMLEKANKLKANDPYIIDSLGWALFKLEKFKASKNYLRLAVQLMPADPVVNDHYGDALWKNGYKIQARYYWKYVLKLKEAEDNLKEKIKIKLISGL